MEFLRNTWYFAAWSQEIGDAPLHRRIVGEEVAFYRDADGRVNAIGAICPHRGANLASGRVVDGALACPYHGWRYGSDGHCLLIPSQPPDHKIPPGARVPVYSVCEQQGVVWIWPGRNSAPFEAAPRFDMFDDEASLVRSDPELLASEFLNVVENAFDDSHVHFLHRTTIGVGTPILPRQTVEHDADARGLTMRWDVESPWGLELLAAMDTPHSWFGRFLLRRYGTTDYDQRYARMRLGGVILFHLPTKTGHVQTVIGAATPMDAGHTWFTTALSHPLARSRLARPVLRWFIRTLNAEDQIGTTHLLRGVSELESPISVQADRGALALRRIHADALRRELEPRSSPLAETA